ncbi:carboxylic acid transporter protein [Cantharellus anzutake]|uniref:carboxylic acid transporter protein n=1 Tax=Cantharellus anzutake TaxID=1750568 RepID=UPI001904FBB1|nr:carboxylic acid transporter protein [Cantharellus anzutake]KAF8342266.1 carboxylic acid transporter protein [Cantharellus anzutake]
MRSFGDVAANHLQGYKLPAPPRRGGPSKLRLLKELSLTQWLMFLSGWLAWTCDAIDFFSVSLQVTRLSQQFHRNVHDITTSITLTLLFRSIGAVIFGLASDRYGRKYPLILNLAMIAVLQVLVSFTQNFHQFLVCRSLFGLAMGGVWGMASATALENLPVELRGVASGVVQQGYALGYLVAAVFSLTVVPHNKHGWRSLFWCACGFTTTAILLRLSLPESELFLRNRREKKEKELLAKDLRDQTGNGAAPVQKSATQVFIQEIGEMFKRHWALCIYAVLLMSGFNFLSHGSQDLYPTYLKESKGFDNYHSTVATIIGSLGAICGGVTAGYISQYLGRRLTIIVYILSIGCFIPLWIIPNSFGKLAAGAFCVQFGVQGAWGVIPIQLAELSPAGFRATFPGLMYQLGNMISSSAAQIEAIGGENLRTTLNGKNVPDYAKVQGILLGTVAVFTILVTFLGPENHSSHFGDDVPALERGRGKGDIVVSCSPDSPGGAEEEKKSIGQSRCLSVFE